MLDAQLEHQLIGRVYAAALQSENWPDVLKEMAELLSATSCFFANFDALNPGRNVTVAFGIAPEAMREYQERWAVVDMQLHVPLLLEAGVCRVSSNNDFLGANSFERYKQYAGDFYLFLRRCKMSFTMGALLGFGDYEWAVVGFHRCEEAGPFCSQTQAILQRWTEHLRRALQIHRQFIGLTDRFCRLRDLLDQLECSVLLLGDAGQVRHANRKASALLVRTPALRLGAAGRLHAALAHEDGRFQRLLHTAITCSIDESEQAGGVICLHHPELAQPIKVSVTQFATDGLLAAMADEGVRAALFISDPNQPREVAPTYLQSVYGLTRRECLIANALLNGQSMQAIAEQAGVSIQTVRSQMKSIFAKTAVDSQARLVALLSALTNEFVHEPCAISPDETAGKSEKNAG